MKITEIITVERDPEEVWDLFQDVPALTQCLPGAELTEVRDDGTYAGKVSVKLGPMTSTFEGVASVEGNHDTRTGTVDGKGADRRGGSRGQVKVHYSITPCAVGTEVTVDADVHLMGAVAQFGRTGLIKELSTRLIDEFVQCLESKLSATTEEEAAAVSAGEVRGFALVFSSLVVSIVDFLKRWLGPRSR